MRKTKLISLLLCAVMLTAAFLPCVVFAGTTGEFFYHINDDGTLSIDGYAGGAGETLVIPGEYYGYKVSSVNLGLEKYHSFKEVIIEAGVGELSTNIFMNWEGLERATILGTDTKFNPGLFYGCPNLKTVSLPEGLKTISRSMFARCTSLESIEIPVSVETIEDYALMGCTALTSVTFPTGLKTVGKDIIDGCTGLKTVEVPAAITDITQLGLYNYNALESITLAEGNTSFELDGGVLYNKGKTSLVLVPRYFKGSVVIPDTVTELSDRIFGSSSIESITIPGSIGTVKANSFIACENLKSVTLCDGVTTVEEDSFYGCDSLEKVTISHTVSVIAERAFGAAGSERNLVIHGYTGSAAEAYATANGHEFVSLGDSPDKVDSAELFDDISPDDWFKPYVDYVVSNNLMKGTSDTDFAPGATMTRAMLVTVLYRMESEPEVSAQSPFTDLTQDWYRGPVAWAHANGIVAGTSDSTFSPDSPITREQLATILFRYKQFKGEDTTKRDPVDLFVDGELTSGWAADAVSWAIADGLITGSRDGDILYLDPKGSATRAQVATILMRLGD